jgi:hypothetical protein
METKAIVGRAEMVDFPRQKLVAVPARIDSGAKTSAIWASDIGIKNGKLEFKLFDRTSSLYTGKVLRFSDYGSRNFSSTIGARQQRYVVKLVVRLNGRLIKASFSLADRSAQVYPVLIGRNILRGKFVVDVSQGTPLREREQARSKNIQQSFKKEVA